MAAFDASGIRYLVVGGIAIGFYAAPRYTKDLDLLNTVQAPVHIIRPEELLDEDFVFHFGAPPWRVDVLTSIPDIAFEAAYAAQVPLPLGDYTATCIDREWLIRVRRSSSGLLDLENLGGA